MVIGTQEIFAKCIKREMHDVFLHMKVVLKITNNYELDDVTDTYISKNSRGKMDSGKNSGLNRWHEW